MRASVVVELLPGALAVAVAVAVAVVVVVVAWLLWRGPVRTVRLRTRYLRALHLPPREAEATLARQLSHLRERYPGRSQAWYLEWLHKALTRDRR